jgi:membrane protease YdiL (CAAX protease family)
MNPPIIKPLVPWLMLFSRTVLFAVFQISIAGFLALAGLLAPWEASAAWWTISALFTNLASIILLVWLFRQENRRYFEFIPASHQTFWKDLGLALLLMMVLMPMATLPNQWLANWLFGSEEVAFGLMFRPLPLWAGVLSLLFPLTIAFAELPTYFGYVMPRLEKQLGNGWLAWALASFFLALQHITLPLIFDWRFIVWRLGMFIPLAFLMGLGLKLRPQLFPYLMAIHALLDMTTVVMLLML